MQLGNLQVKMTSPRSTRSNRWSDAWKLDLPLLAELSHQQHHLIPNENAVLVDLMFNLSMSEAVLPSSRSSLNND